MRRTTPLNPLISGYAPRFVLFQQDRMNDQPLNMIQ